MYRILLMGINGQLGWELHRTLECLGELYPIDREVVDFADVNALRRVIRIIQPQLIINAAAFTNVDLAEMHPGLAYQVNSAAIEVIAIEAQKIRSAIIHYSTDYVFDGTSKSMYSEVDIPNPTNVYGKSKLAGERILIDSGLPYWIIRTSWLYSMRRRNFVRTVLRAVHSRKTMSVVTDQIGSPTWSRQLAEITSQLIRQGGKSPAKWIEETTGIYHIAGDGWCNRYDFASEIIKSDPDHDDQTLLELIPTLSVFYPCLASRPLFSALDCSLVKSTFKLQMNNWQDELYQCLRG